MSKKRLLQQQTFLNVAYCTKLFFYFQTSKRVPVYVQLTDGKLIKSIVWDDSSLRSSRGVRSTDSAEVTTQGPSRLKPTNAARPWPLRDACYNHRLVFISFFSYSKGRRGRTTLSWHFSGRSRVTRHDFTSVCARTKWRVDDDAISYSNKYACCVRINLTVVNPTVYC